MTISLYYKDPEGNFVELQSDSFSDWTLSSEWMRTSVDFAQNPIGTFFDPARVYDAFKSGIDFKALQQTTRRRRSAVGDWRVASTIATAFTSSAK
jgi:hypothetical protein